MTAVKSGGVLQLYAGLWTYSRGMRPTMVAAYLMLTSSELIKLALPWLSGLAIDALQREGVAGMSEAAVDGALILVCLLASWALHGPGRVMERYVALHVKTSAAASFTTRLLDAPVAWHRTRHSADSAGRILQASQALYQFAESQYMYLQSAVSLFGPIVALWLISAWVGATAAVGYALLAFISMRFGPILVRLGVQQYANERRYTSALMDYFGQIFTVLALRRRSRVEKIARGRLSSMFSLGRRVSIFNEVRWAVIDLLANALWLGLVALYVWIASRQSGAGQSGVGQSAVGMGGLALGAIVMVHEYIRRADSVLTVLVGRFGTIDLQVAGYAAADSLRQLTQEPRIEQPASTPWNTLELRSVTYAYGQGERMSTVLRGVDLTLRRGRTYALVGSSGAGKTTLLHLLAGLDAASTGSIYCDGRPVDMMALRREATLLPQQVELYEGSIRDNLLLGHPQDAAKVDDILHAVDAQGFVFAQDEGLDASVAEHGKNWSGGQRQRLALARGLLAAQGSSLILLDEPNSSLDSQCERRVLEGVFRSMPGCTIVVALHGLHLLDMFDSVLVAQEGRVVECESPSALSQHPRHLRELLAASGGQDGEVVQLAEPA